MLSICRRRILGRHFRGTSVRQIKTAPDAVIPLKVNGTAQFGTISCTGIQFSAIPPQTFLSTYMEEKLTLIWQVTDQVVGPTSTGATDVIFTRFGRAVTASITGPLLQIPATGTNPSAGFPQTVAGQIPARYGIGINGTPQYIPIPIDAGGGTQQMGLLYMNSNPTWFLYSSVSDVLSSLPGFQTNVTVIPRTTTITYNIA